MASTKYQRPPRRRLIDLHDAADRLGSSARSVRRLISAGTLAGYRVGPRQLRVDEAELEAHIAESKVPAAHPAGR